jgi:hypothetical protein
MSTNYRAYKIDVATSGSTGLGEGSSYPRAWGIMKGEFNVSGSLTLEGGGVINLASLDNHQIFPCYPKLLTITAGSLYILS